MDPFANAGSLRWVNRKQESVNWADGRSIHFRSGTVSDMQGDECLREETVEFCGLDCGCTVSVPLEAVRCMVCDALVCQKRHCFVCSICHDNVCNRCSSEVHAVEQTFQALCLPCKQQHSQSFIGKLLHDLFGGIWKELMQ